MNRIIIVWAIASMLIVVTAVTGKTAEMTSLISQGAALDGAAVEAVTESVLWNFGVTSDDGNQPGATLLADKKGNLYGTTYVGGANGGGTVFELSPPTGKQTEWTESVLWSFGATSDDGTGPFVSGLIADKNGNLYGTTLFGSLNGGGMAFELSPPSGKQTQWTENILWSFGAGDDGANPASVLLADQRGNLYGTTNNGGATGDGMVFELSPPTGKQTQWTENVLWNLGADDDGANPYAGLIADNQGHLYGATSGGGATGSGTVFEMSPPSGKQTQWTEKVLWSFGAGDDGKSPYCDLITDNQRNLYGTTNGGGGNGGGAYGDGVVFELSPPSGKQAQWTEKVLWSFGATSEDGHTPFAGLLSDKRGNLYGTTLGGGANGAGIIFELTQPSDKRIPWTESILWNFGATSDDGNTPFGGLIFQRGNYYGTTTFGGANGDGTVFELTLP
jgi:uncharacterized repeat protein (TIGR03803 family)